MIGKDDTWDQGVREGGLRKGTEGGRRWLDHRSEMNGLITIIGMRKMYDSVNVMFKFDTNSGRGVESESGRIGRIVNLGGNL